MPPTINLTSSSIATTAKKPLEEKLKQLQPLQNNTTTITTSQTTSTTTTSSASSLSTYLSTKSSYINSTNNEYKRKKLFHLTNNNYPNRTNNNNNNTTQRPAYQQSSAYQQQQNPNIYLQPQAAYFQYNQNIPAVYYNPFTNNSQFVNNQQGYSQTYSVPSQQHPATSFSIQNSHVKLEPVEHTEQQQVQHFTNPIPFKQEPNDFSFEMHQQQYQSNSSSSSSSSALSSSSSSTTAISHTGEPTAIVNNLLKDQQVLSLLEKVAEAFRPPTQSMYQVI